MQRLITSGPCALCPLATLAVQERAWCTPRLATARRITRWEGQEGRGRGENQIGGLTAPLLQLLPCACRLA